MHSFKEICESCFVLNTDPMNLNPDGAPHSCLNNCYFDEGWQSGKKLVPTFFTFYHDFSQLRVDWNNFQMIQFLTSMKTIQHSIIFMSFSLIQQYLFFPIIFLSISICGHCEICWSIICQHSVRSNFSNRKTIEFCKLCVRINKSKNHNLFTKMVNYIQNNNQINQFPSFFAFFPNMSSKRSLISSIQLLFLCFVWFRTIEIGEMICFCCRHVWKLIHSGWFTEGFFEGGQVAIDCSVMKEVVFLNWENMELREVMTMTNNRAK